MRGYKLQNHSIKLSKTRLFRVCDLTSCLVSGIKATSRRDAMLKGMKYFNTSKVMIMS